MKSSQPPSRELESLRRSREGLGQALKNLLTYLGYDPRGVDDYLQRCDAHLAPGACNPALDVVIKAGREVPKMLGWSRGRLAFRRNRLLRAYRECSMQKQRIQILEADIHGLKDRLDLELCHSSDLDENSQRWQKIAIEAERASVDMAASLSLAERRASLAEEATAAVQKELDELKRVVQVKLIPSSEEALPTKKFEKKRRGAKVREELKDEARPTEEAAPRKRRQF